MRAFLAIALPDSVRASLTVLRDQLAGSQADVKWVASEQLHLTLKFLGDITDEQRDAMEALMATVAGASAPFTAQLQELGAFPSLVSPRVVWVGMREGRDQLARIAQALEEGARRAGFVQEERPFAAHVTLGRVRSSKRRSALSARMRQISWEPPPAWCIEAIRLYHSALRSSGPSYHILTERHLGSDPRS